jgi:hypothetical protein
LTVLLILTPGVPIGMHGRFAAPLEQTGSSKMSISAVSPAAVLQAPDNSARVQLERDQKKLVADTQAGASAAVIAADQMAVTSGERAVSSSGSTVDMYL